MTDDNNKDGNPDFEDDVFDETSFDESYYEDDEAVFDEADLPDDAEFEDVDFEETDWSEDDVGPVAGKKEKSLYRTEKKPFLNFNTIVILGAFIVGAGVLVFTVMGQSSKVSSGAVPKFISSLNIGDVMDGKLFGIGGNEESPISTETPLAEDAATTQDGGFLDNPDGIELQATSSDLPPQPSPISPTEIAPDTALTPMPEIVAGETSQNDGMTPRGPDEIVATTEEPVEANDAPAVVPEEKAQPSAEDILKRALANRGQQQQEEPKAEEQVAVVEEAPEEVPVVPIAIPEPVVTPVPTPVADVVVPSEPVKDPVVEKPVPVQVNAASDEAIKSLESKIDTMLKRMEQIETELSTVREGREDEYESLEKTVTSLKGDIVALKKAPTPKPQAAPKDETKPFIKTEVKKTETPKKAPAPAKRDEPAYSPPKPAATAPAQQAATWELRAAQPGKAWVSKAGQRDMQGIVVGETLSGIGRVTAISYQNGRWVVTGTQGQIRQ